MQKNEAAASDYTYTYDLQTGIVSSTGGIGFAGANYVTIAPPADNQYSPEALAGEGIR